MVSVLPVGLYEAWQVDGEIPNREAPPLRQSQKTAIKAKRIAELVRERRQTAAAYDPTTTIADLEYIAQEDMQRNYWDHYTTVIEWAVAIRIWASQSISVAEARRAQDCHNRACQDWARMFCHLTPYFHIMIHFLIFVLCLGPVYAWWAYVYERFNGWLSKVNHNGHKGGELEATLMRSWTKLHLMHDLVCDIFVMKLSSLTVPIQILQLEGLGDAKSPEDEDSIRDLKKCLQGEKRPSQSRGTLLNTIALMTAQESGGKPAHGTVNTPADPDDIDLVKWPKHGRKLNLRPEGLYNIVFNHLRDTWSDLATLIPDTSYNDIGSPFIAVAVPSYSHVIVAGQRYGNSTAARGIKYRYAYIDGRQPVDIIHLFRVQHTTNDGTELEAELAIVRPFIHSIHAPDMPWATRSVPIISCLCARS